MLYDSRANTEPPVKSTQEVAEEMGTPRTRPLGPDSFKEHNRRVRHNDRRNKGTPQRWYLTFCLLAVFSEGKIVNNSLENTVIQLWTELMLVFLLHENRLQKQDCFGVWGKAAVKASALPIA